MIVNAFSGPKRTPALVSHAPLFRSFWMGGFESACHINRAGERLDMIASTQHDELAAEDYARLRQFGIRTVREAVRWHLVERRPGVFDFSDLDGMLQAARRAHMQVIWTLCHYGWPDGLDLFGSEFVDRFAAFSRAAAHRLREESDDVALFAPVNEISFTSWAAGEVGNFYPHARGRGLEAKVQLVRASIAAADAIWSVSPTARLISIEPVIHIVPPAGRPEYQQLAAAFRETQFESWDMLSGAKYPELGGAPRYLDVMGVNFYHDNQWEHPGDARIDWHVKPRDPRWIPFHRLVGEVYARYQRPVFVGETSHIGVGRAEWMAEMTREVELAVENGVPLEGMCLYPVIDRFDWDNRQHWHNSGLWDLERDATGRMQRVLNEDYASELRRCMARLPASWAGPYGG